MPKRSARKIPLADKPWEDLSPAQQEIRERALSTLSKIRQGSSLYSAAREVRIDPRTATRYLANALRKKSGKFLARKVDKISRGIVIYSEGKQRYIVVNDSRFASTIGKYFNAVRQLIHAGDDKMLKTFEGAAVVDSKLVKYYLETDPRRILAIEETREEPEFFHIYGRG